MDLGPEHERRRHERFDSTQRWVELVSRRRPPYDTFTGWYERVWGNLSTPDYVAEVLGLTAIEIHEMAYERRIFSIEEERQRFIPLEQFQHFAGYSNGVRQFNPRVSARLESFWKGLDELIPHCAQSKWLLWSLLFWKDSGISKFTTGGEMRSLVNCSDKDWPRISSGIREKLVSFEHRSRHLDIATLESQANVHILI